MQGGVNVLQVPVTPFTMTVMEKTEKTSLPPAYQHQIEALLKAEAPAFWSAMEQPPRRALRLSTEKLDRSHLTTLTTWPLTPVPWEPLGLLYPEEAHPGTHPLHAAGAYYIQEPSAMLPARLLSPLPDERVLDLCAAPGGKTTQLAALMENTGLLIANEIHPARAKILSENVERLGCSSCIVLNEAPERLAERFPFFFDKILVDAPCSGEGMFRKDPEAVKEWTEETNRLCAERQQKILSSAAEMLIPGGRLAYSTCTFSPLENEEVIRAFLSSHPDFALLREERIWPHKAPGEGHFAALLERTGEARASLPPIPEKPARLPGTVLPFFRDLLTDLSVLPLERAFLSKDQLYLRPAACPDLSGLKVLRPGLHLGTLKKDRIEPAHALSHALPAAAFARVLPLSEEEAKRFLGGEALPTDLSPGWGVAAFAGLPLGFGKSTGTRFQNHYPKGLRRTYSQRSVSVSAF